MESKFVLIVLALAYMVAKLEINIEGKAGWAEKLPTWKIKNSFTDLILGGAPLTGYHFWLFATILFLLHLVFFINLPWDLASEFKLFGYFFLFLILEDFLWFILNPAYGILKFNKQNIPWHKNWIGLIPRSYLYGSFLSILCFWASGIFS